MGKYFPLILKLDATSETKFSDKIGFYKNVLLKQVTKILLTWTWIFKDIFLLNRTSSFLVKSSFSSNLQCSKFLRSKRWGWVALSYNYYSSTLGRYYIKVSSEHQRHRRLMWFSWLLVEQVWSLTVQTVLSAPLSRHYTQQYLVTKHE